MQFEIPDALPVLSKGNHQPGSGKACIMDAVSIISGRAFEKDRPSCVHPFLRPLFITVNDSVGDQHRHRLWPLGLRAMGTDDVDLESVRADRVAASTLLRLARAAYARQAATQSTKEHPIAEVLPNLLSWMLRPNHSDRWNLQRIVGSARVHKCGCSGCLYLLKAAQATFQTSFTNPFLGLMTAARGVEDKFEVLAAVLDVFEELTPCPAPVVNSVVTPVVDWESLRESLGTVTV